MNPKDHQIKELINNGLSIVKRMSGISSITPAGPNTRELMKVVNALCPLIQNNFPLISNIIGDAGKQLIYKNGLINAFFYGDIRTSLIILKSKYEKPRKIFISHSSKDKTIISEFVDHILQLGVGIEEENIFCTSIEDMDIRNGEDIRNHIKKNILSSDFSILMISENYKKSEICLNEMGAVWVNDCNVRYFILPEAQFDEIGWLCNAKKAEHILNRTALDKLYKELNSYYKLGDHYESWSRQRETFIDNVEKEKDTIDNDIEL